jgi:hypothetical protein
MVKASNAQAVCVSKKSTVMVFTMHHGFCFVFAEYSGDVLFVQCIIEASQRHGHHLQQNDDGQAYNTDLFKPPMHIAGKSTVIENKKALLNCHREKIFPAYASGASFTFTVNFSHVRKKDPRVTRLRNGGSA